MQQGLKFFKLFSDTGLLVIIELMSYVHEKNEQCYWDNFCKKYSPKHGVEPWTAMEGGRRARAVADITPLQGRRV